MEAPDRLTASGRRSVWTLATASAPLAGLCGLAWWDLARRAAVRNGHPAIHPRHAKLHAHREITRHEHQVHRSRNKCGG